MFQLKEALYRSASFFVMEPGSVAETMSKVSRIEAIFIASQAKAQVARVAEVVALEGRGLSGDRYASGQGAFSRFPGIRREVTLICADALVDAETEFGVRLSAGEHRRNIVVRGVDLSNLIGSKFSIGDAVMKGVQLCAPCGYLGKIQGQPGLRDALKGRGGIRAHVVSGGLIREGDTISARHTQQETFE